MPVLKDIRAEKFKVYGFTDNPIEAYHTDSSEKDKPHTVEDLKRYLPSFTVACFMHIVVGHYRDDYYSRDWKGLNESIQKLATYLKIKLPNIVHDGRNVVLDNEVLKSKDIYSLEKQVTWGWMENQRWVRYMVAVAKTIETSDAVLLNLLDKFCSACGNYAISLVWQ